MKILYIIHTYYPARGGCENKIKNLAEYMVSMGDEVTVFTSNAPNTYAFLDKREKLMETGEEIINGVKVVRFKVIRVLNVIFRYISEIFYKFKLPFNDILRTVYTGPLFKGIIKRINDSEFDIVISASFPFLTMYYPVFAKKKNSFPFCIIPSIHPEDKWSFDRKIMKFVLNASDIIFISTEHERNFLKEFSVEDSKIEVLPEVVDLTNTYKESSQNLKNEFELENNPVVGFVGRHVDGKGIDVLINSMKDVWDIFPDINLLIAGSTSSYTAKIEKKIKSLPGELQKKILMINDFSNSEKVAIYEAIDILALPSKIESFGIVILEMWHFEKPVIGCNSGGIPLVIDNNENGLLVEYGNTGELSKAIIKLLSDENLRKELGFKGKKKVKENYMLESVAEKTRRKYEELVKRVKLDAG